MNSKRQAIIASIVAKLKEEITAYFTARPDIKVHASLGITEIGDQTSIVLTLKEKAE